MRTALCNLVEVDLRFRDAYCHRNQGDGKLAGKEFSVLVSKVL